MISRRESFSSSEVRVVAPYPLTRTVRIKPADEGKSVLTFFDERFPYVGKKQWLHRMDSGWICRGGEALHENDILSAHQLIHHFTPRVLEPSVAAGVQVLQETDEWVIVYKPAPLPMHQGGRYYKNTLIYILSERGYFDLRMVHRLDAVTSGVVVLAKTKEFAKHLRGEFEAGRVVKWYHAVVKGEMTEVMSVNAPIRRKRGFIFECGERLEGSKAAETLFEPIRYHNGRTLVKCIPITGRTHQIRLHLRHAGFPIVDDPIYGPNGDQSGERLQNCAISLRSTGIMSDEAGIRADLESYPEFHLNHHHSESCYLMENEYSL